MKFVRVGAAVGAVAIIVTACSSTPSGSGAAAGGTPIKVGIELPMTGGEAPNGVPTANGVQLALEQIKVDGYNITINQQDDAVNGKHNADQGAKNMTDPGQRHRGPCSSSGRTTPASRRPRSRSATRRA